MFFSEHRRLVDLVAKNRLPAVYSWREFFDAGGLMSYGLNVADLPVEQPTKFELVINLTAAKALGLTVPPSVLGGADQVIE
jgi:putative ABC transport system substrate-binding protein